MNTKENYDPRHGRNATILRLGSIGLAVLAVAGFGIAQVTPDEGPGPIVGDPPTETREEQTVVPASISASGARLAVMGHDALGPVVLPSDLNPNNCAVDEHSQDATRSCSADVMIAEINKHATDDWKYPFGWQIDYYASKRCDELTPGWGWYWSTMQYPNDASSAWPNFRSQSGCDTVRLYDGPDLTGDSFDCIRTPPGMGSYPNCENLAAKGFNDRAESFFVYCKALTTGGNCD